MILDKNRAVVIKDSDATRLEQSLRNLDAGIDELVSLAYDNACARGWHEKERTIGEIISLCHSELSEAAEAFEDERVSTKLPDTLETVEEFADAIIRIMDWFGRHGASLHNVIHSMPHLYIAEVRIGVESAGENFYKQVSDMHCDLSTALEFAREGSQTHTFRYMALCLLRIMEYSRRCGLAVEEAVIAKHNYNTGREHRHGGKLF